MENKKYDLLINRLAMKHRKPVSVIRNMVESQFEFISNTVKNIDFNSIESKEEFQETKTNFNVKYLFSLVANYTMLKKIKENEAKSKSNKKS